MQFFIAELVGTTLIIYLLSRGLSLYESNMTIAVFAVTVFVMETPTGVIADLYGRRTSVVSGIILQGVAYGLSAFADSFEVFLLIQFITGTAYTLQSGALEAWVVDYVKYENAEVKIGNLFTTVFTIRNSAGIFCGVLGGYLANINMRLPWIVSVCLIVITSIFTLIVMKEPYFKKKKHSENKMTNLKDSVREIIRDSYNHGLKNKFMLIALIIGVLMSFSNSAGNAFQQPRILGLAGKGPWIMGWIKAGYSIFMILGAKFVAHLNKKREHSEVLGIACLMIGFWLILAGVFNTFTSVLMVFLIYEIGRGMYKPALQTYLNHRIDSDKRATILSFSSAVSQFGMVLGLVVTGKMNSGFSGLDEDQYYIRLAWVVCGIVALAAWGICFTMLKDRKDKDADLDKCIVVNEEN